MSSRVGLGRSGSSSSVPRSSDMETSKYLHSFRATLLEGLALGSCFHLVTVDLLKPASIAALEVLTPFSLHSARKRS